VLGGHSLHESAFGYIMIRQRDPTRSVIRAGPIMQRL
jgi:hypothetical protein